MTGSLIRGFGEFSDKIGEVRESDPEFEGFLAKLDKAGRHYVAIALSLWLDRFPRLMGPGNLGKLIRSNDRPDVITKLADECPEGLVALLDKLTSDVMGPADYITLFRLMQDDIRSKVLEEFPDKIRASLIHAMAQLPDELVTLDVAGSVKGAYHAARLAYGVKVANTFRPELEPRALARSFLKDQSHLRIDEWLGHWLKPVQWPEPPWDGGAYLEPIANFNQLRLEAKRFGEPWLERLPLIHAGMTHFYIYEDDEDRALVRVDKDPFLGWIVTEISGDGSRSVSYQTEERVIKEFADAGIGHVPFYHDIDLGWR